MSNSMGLPPDIAEQMKNKPPGGIGSGVKENAATAHQRQVAMGEPQKKQEATTETFAGKDAKTEPDLQLCPNASCGMAVEIAWRFCPQCSTNLQTDVGKVLGITFDSRDLEDYLFKGYVVKDITFLRNHKATLKSAQPSDFEAIDNYIMNGDWGKNPDGSERKVSDFYMRQVNAMCMTASSVVKIDGQSIGSTLEEKMAWFRERGSGFVDILSQKTNLFIQMLSEHLKKEDSFLGS